ncbi:MAG: hypothetical protein ABIO46_08825 [Chitinophagales bacterium]
MKPLLLTLTTMLFHICSFAQDEQKTVFEISGQVMTDAGYNFNQMNPDY